MFFCHLPPFFSERSSSFFAVFIWYNYLDRRKDTGIKMSGMKLYTDMGNWRAFKCLIAAEYNGIDVEVPNFKMCEDNMTPEFREKSPLGKVPLLETPQGCIFESNAIARYLSRLRRDTGLYGENVFESAQIDAWVDFCSHEIELPASLW